MNVIIFLFFMLFSVVIQADPAPFGLVINKTTTEELKGKYPVTPLGINKNNGMQAFDIEPQNIDFEGLISAKAAFGDDGVLKIVQMSLPKTKFEDIFTSLSKKYTLVYKNIPVDGNKEAKFIEGNTYILLYAPQASTEMDFLYINKKLLEDALQLKPEAQAKKNKEISQL
ncbi:MAG: hypothetical protein Q8M03_03245 [Legionella sp.]|nr:hypothetical protein [Legionella sp.]